MSAKTILAILFLVLAFAVAGGLDRQNLSDYPDVTQSMVGER